MSLLQPTNNLQIVENVTVSASDVKAGEVLLYAPPLVTGPGRAGFPICITCYSRVDGEYYCNGCSWQCCDEQCELRDVHREECEIFKEKDIYAAWNSVDEPTLSMDFMGPHRLLLAIKKDPTLKILLKKDMQNELRKQRFNIKYYVGCEETICKYIIEQCGLTGFTNEEILTALGLFEILGLPLKNGAKAFYLEVAFMENSCIPNTYFNVQSDGSLLMKASVDIRKGEKVTRCFADVMKCNQFRRINLEKEFFIECDCRRCNDGSELGTNYGGIIMQDYNNHVFTQINQKVENSPWGCAAAPGLEVDGKECRNDFDLLRRKCEDAIAETQGNIGTVEFILNNPGEWDRLPGKGQVMMDIKKCLVQGYGNSYGNTYDVLTSDKIKTKIEICEELLELYAKFHPGYNYDVAMLHYEVANAVCGLVAKGDKTMVELGLRHCASVLEICRIEAPGSMYQQLSEFISGLVQGLKSLS